MGSDRGARGPRGARGTLYAVVGILAIAVAVGLRHHTPDREGAFRTIGRKP